METNHIYSLKKLNNYEIILKINFCKDSVPKLISRLHILINLVKNSINLEFNNYLNLIFKKLKENLIYLEELSKYLSNLPDDIVTSSGIYRCLNYYFMIETKLKYIQAMIQNLKFEPGLINKQIFLLSFFNENILSLLK